MRRIVTSLVCLAVAAVLAACDPSPTQPSVPEGWSYAGGDEFSAPLDTTFWDIEHSTYGDGNNELACLRPNNLTVSDGTLKIEARKENVTCPGNKARSYSSGFISTRDNGVYMPTFGRFEMRARLPHSQGLWPAFWLRHIKGAQQYAEVDVMEYFHSQVPGKTTNTLHLDGDRNLGKVSTTFESVNDYGWHIWAVEILPYGDGDVRFQFFLDGTLTSSYVDTDPQWLNHIDDPNKAWDIAVNMAVGGDWAGDPDGQLGHLPNISKCSIWGGTYPDGCSTTNINRVDWNRADRDTYEIDYVRAFSFTP